jgi:hypothetical protein
MFLRHTFLSSWTADWEPGKRSQYSDCLRAGRPRGRISSSGRVKNFLFSLSSRPALGSAEPPIKWVPGALSPGIERPGGEFEAHHSSPTSAEVEKMWIYISPPPIRLHGVVLNSLSTRTRLPLWTADCQLWACRFLTIQNTTSSLALLSGRF